MGTGKRLSKPYFVYLCHSLGRCGCDVEVLHGYCPSQPDSIKCCPKSSEDPDDDSCQDDVTGGEDCSEITCKKGENYLNL